MIFPVETSVQLSTPSLARRLGDTAHVSPLLHKVCQMSGCSEGQVGEWLLKCAVQRGASHYERPFASDLPPDNPELSNEEVAVALCLGQHPYNSVFIRAAAQLLSSPRTNAPRLARLAVMERVEPVLLYIAKVAARFAPAAEPWSYLVRHLPQRLSCSPDALPHWSRFVSQTADPDPRAEFHQLYEVLRSDERRNRMICADVVSAVNEGRSPLLLTERTEHLHDLAQRLSADVPHVVLLRGGQSRKELEAAFARLTEIPESAGRVIIATGKYIGEGFDDPRLDTLFLVLPVSWRGTIAQYVGRLHRLHDGKREVRVYDYADLDVPMLARMFDKRCRGYEALGYTILLPASAMPGWPAEVPLPIDPEWKKDYAASVRRLIRDGVDVPLANLFVHAARAPTAEADCEDRARSASEAFLFRRLQKLSETAGRFRLNVELPICFDSRGQMEVDFLWVESRIVIELDGAQHLADAEAYRRDRRKDALLQQHGYFVLRFLAEDVGKHLDHVLDTILNAVVYREKTTKSS